MPELDRIWDEKNRTRVLGSSAGILLAIAVLDWLTRPFISLGFLYLFPIMLAAGFLPRSAVAALGAACAVLAEAFSSLEPSFVRLLFETLALAGCGLFVAELIRVRRIVLAVQAAATKAEERLRALVETSPAAIVTVDDRGLIEMANRAAVDLLAPRAGNLLGDPVAAFLPELHHALRWEEAPQFRTTMQCRGHKGNGENFLADVWFSTYKEGSAPKLAAIIAEIADEVPIGSHDAVRENGSLSLQTREAEVLRLLVQGLANKEIAARLAVSESTVKNALQQLFTKTGVRTRSQLVRVALEEYRNIL